MTSNLFLTLAIAAPLMLGQLSSMTQLAQTGVASDLAIQGPGWFVLRDPASNKFFLTRSGNFFLDGGDYLVSPVGMRVQGYSDGTLSVLGDIRVDPADGTPTDPVTAFSFTREGLVRLALADGSSLTAGQILLQAFKDPERLPREAHNLYSWDEAAGPMPQAKPPSSGGLGSLLSGWLDVTPEPVRVFLIPSATTAGVLAKGVLTPTGRTTDLGLRGDGLFLVREPKTSELYATRAGLFLRDADGYLVTYDRLRVQGYSDPALSVRGDVRIDGSGAPLSTASVAEFCFDSDGAVGVQLSDGTFFVRSQVLVATFAHPELLSATNHGLYAGVSQAGPKMAAPSNLRQGSLELINVPADLLAMRRLLGFFAQGPLSFDPVLTHLALSGPGFFVLRDPDNGTEAVTRSGAFMVDPSGYLVNSEGWRVQGYNTGSLNAVGDLSVVPEGAHGEVAEFSFGWDGKLSEVLADGTAFVRGQLLLQDFAESFLLKKQDQVLFTNLEAAVPLPQPLPPGSAGMGRLFEGVLELPTPPEHLTLPSRNGPRVGITGEPGRHWIIESTEDLVHWDVLGEVTNGLDEVEFTDTASIGRARRFYRVEVKSGVSRWATINAER